MGGRLSGLGNALYDSKRRQFLGRDGAQWGKLGVFYFFFYLGLAGFFCAMLAVFMALTPRDHPYYTSQDSRMKTRSNPLSPGLGFRPQPNVERNLIQLEKNSYGEQSRRHAESLERYLQVYYGEQSPNGQNVRNKRQYQQQQYQQQPYQQQPYQQQQQPYQQQEQTGNAPVDSKFIIRNTGECTNASRYGYSSGRPCVLVKMNKIVDFEPIPVRDYDKKDFAEGCKPRQNVVTIGCQGEYPADMDNIGPIKYMSESGQNEPCGTLNLNRFPYRGKVNRQDVYQAPYVWVQFTDPKPNVLINVICRVYGENIDYDKKAGRGLTRFQIFVNGDPSKRVSRAGEI